MACERLYNISVAFQSKRLRCAANAALTRDRAAFLDFSRNFLRDMCVISSVRRSDFFRASRRVLRK